MYRSGCAAGCCPEDGGLSPLGRQAEEDYEEEMRFRRTAVPVTERAAAGVLCLVPCFLFSHEDIPDTIKTKTYRTVRKRAGVPDLPCRGGGGQPNIYGSK